MTHRLPIAVLAATVAASLAGCAGLMRTEAELAQKSSPAAQPVAAHLVSADTALRTAPDQAAPEKGRLSAGAPVEASAEQVRGFRRVRTADGATGWVESGALSAATASAAPAATAQ